MIKLLASLGLYLFSALSALAAVPCSVPFNLTNGTTADASQVMANYNAILSCLANGAAASGANNDITALLALVTPIAPAAGGTTVYIGNSATGTNAISIVSTTPGGFGLVPAYKVRFIAGGANTAATSLNVAGTGIENFYRSTPLGPAPMVGGEILAGQAVEAEWDGTEYQMVSQPALAYPPGAVFDYAGAACPAGSLATNGSSLISQTAYPTLYTIVGTIWGAAAGGNFTVPDLEGRATYGVDTEGTRITAAGGNFNATNVGATGGRQNQALSSTAQLPVFTPSIVSPIALSASVGGVAGSGSEIINNLGSTLQNVSISASFNSIGSASPSSFATLSNAAIIWKCIKG
jgi:microcystin-dependent protein